MDLELQSLSIPFTTWKMEERVLYYVCLTVKCEPVWEKCKQINNLILNICIAKRIQVKFTNVLYWKHSNNGSLGFAQKNLICVYHPSFYQLYTDTHIISVCIRTLLNNVRGHYLGLCRFVTCVLTCVLCLILSDPSKPWSLVDTTPFSSKQQSHLWYSKMILAVVRTFLYLF